MSKLPHSIFNATCSVSHRPPRSRPWCTTGADKPKAETGLEAAIVAKLWEKMNQRCQGTRHSPQLRSLPSEAFVSPVLWQPPREQNRPVPRGSRTGSCDSPCWIPCCLTRGHGGTSRVNKALCHRAGEEGADRVDFFLLCSCFFPQLWRSTENTKAKIIISAFSEKWN